MIPSTQFIHQGSISGWNNFDNQFDDQSFSCLEDETPQIQETPYVPKDLQQTKLEVPPQRKTKKSYRINTSQSRGELKLLRKIISKNGWKEEIRSNGDCDIMWMGLPIKTQDFPICLQVLVNRFPGMCELAHKTQTQLFLNKFRDYFPEDFTFFPRSFILPEQIQEFEEVFKMKGKKSKLYIAKPDAGCQGDGITIINNLKDIQYNRSQVLQEYIKKPLLIDGLKFDLRLYVLVTSLNPYICYLNHEGLARFCTEAYQKPTQANIRNAMMHLTNYSLQKLGPNFIHNTQNINEINNGTKRTLTSIKKNLERDGFDVGQIQLDIEDLIQKFMISMHPFLDYNLKAAFQSQSSDVKCFHIIGFDVLLDEKAKPWLLEVNSNPSLSTSHEVYDPLGKPQSEISPLDEYVKEQVVEDSICLVVKSPKKQKEMMEVGDSYHSFKMLICDGESEQKDLFDKILRIYGWVSGHKFCERISSSKFIKLAGLPGMTNEKFIKVDYNLLFQKILLKDNKQQMDLFSFITALENISQKLFSSFDPKNKYPSIKELVEQIIMCI